MGFWLIGAEIILIMTAFGACAGALIHTTCASMRKSRCSKINCLCFSCIREIESDDLVMAEVRAEETVAKPAQRPRSVDEEAPPPDRGQI